jgi:ribosomal-protein-alanine N-acetyltransferase
MEERDVPFVLKIERLSFSHPWMESAFKGEINNRGISFPFVVVHSHQEKIIGYIIFWLMEEKAQISNFAIHPDFRRLGVGEKVLTRIIAQIRKYGAKSVILEVRPSNFAARRLYEKYGFKSLGIRKDYYRDPGEDALVMVKYFSPS